MAEPTYFREFFIKATILTSAQLESSQDDIEVDLNRYWGLLSVKVEGPQFGGDCKEFELLLSKLRIDIYNY